MKTLLILVLFLSSGSPDAELLTFRKMLYESESNASMAGMFYTATKRINEKSAPVARGYKAMSALMMCKHVSNPLSKLSYFNEGREELESALQEEPGNVELLFLRFSTQSNTPSILGYDGAIQTDKVKLLNSLGTANLREDADLFNKITNFMLQSKYCSAEDKRKIRQQ